jgi:hypothetical protein
MARSSEISVSFRLHGFIFQKIIFRFWVYFPRDEILSHSALEFPAVEALS